MLQFKLDFGSDDLSGINDAFTGRPLDIAKPLFECNGCHVFYQQESVAVLQQVNDGCCMVCGAVSIVARTVTSRTETAQHKARKDLY